MSVRAPEVRAGDQLSPLEIPVTATLIITGAIASRDFQDVHHDRVLAQQQGAKDIFMNMHTTNGLVGRYVTDWAGPDAILKKVAIKLGVPNYAGDTMTLTGTVASVADGVAELDVVGTNALGTHVSARVTLVLPS